MAANGRAPTTRLESGSGADRLKFKTPCYPIFSPVAHIAAFLSWYFFLPRDVVFWLGRAH